MTGQDSRLLGDDASDAWLDLVASMLAVNSYPLERAYALADGLRATGLADPKVLGAWDQVEIARKLGAVGYDRGAFMTGLIARRLASLGRMAVERGLSACTATLEGADVEEIRRVLAPVNGVGPGVIANFLRLRGIDPRSGAAAAGRRG